MQSVKRTVYLNKDGKATLDASAGPVLYMAGAIVSEANAELYGLEAAYNEIASPAVVGDAPAAPVVPPDLYGKTAIKHREKPVKPVAKPKTKEAE